MIFHFSRDFCQDPVVQQAFDQLLLRHPDVEAILLSTADGIPLMRGRTMSHRLYVYRERRVVDC